MFCILNYKYYEPLLCIFLCNDNDLLCFDTFYSHHHHHQHHHHHHHHHHHYILSFICSKLFAFHETLTTLYFSSSALSFLCFHSQLISLHTLLSLYKTIPYNLYLCNNQVFFVKSNKQFVNNE